MAAGAISRNVADAFAPFRKPDLAGFALLAFLAPWLSIFSPRVLGAMLPVAAVIVAAGWRRSHRRWPPIERGPCIAAAVFLALSLASALWAQNGILVLGTVARNAGAFVAAIVLFAAAGELDDADRHRLSRLFAGGVVLGLALTVVNMLTDAGLYRLFGSRQGLVEAVLTNNRPMVLLMLFVWPAGVAAERRWRGAALLLPLAALAVSLLTYSLTATFAGLVGLAVFLLACTWPRAARELTVRGGVFVILAMPWLVLALKAADPGIHFDWEALSVGARIEIWYAVATGILGAPFMGHGIEAVRVVQDWHMAHLYFHDLTVPHPHNGALQVWYELGAAGAAAVAWVWTKTAGRVSAGGDPAALSCLVAILAISCVSHGLWQGWWLAAVGLCPVFFRFTEGPRA
jgi:O-antigen ligase